MAWQSYQLAVGRMGEEASAAHASLLHGRAMLESSCSLDVHLNVCASKLCVCVRVHVHVRVCG